jgi:transcriptional regulator GlxA family with amidase domain
MYFSEDPTQVRYTEIRVVHSSTPSTPLSERHLVREPKPIVDALSTSSCERHLNGARELQPKASARRLEPTQLGRVIEAIQKRIGEPISVSTLSSIAGLSRWHFARSFRMTVGRTPREQIVRMRIEHAMKLMAGTDLPLSGIALAAGFSDQAHFSNNFRRTIGMTPRQWRRGRQP